MCVATSQRKGVNYIMADEKTMVTEEKDDIEGAELDMDVEPTAEEIEEAEKLADKWEAELNG